MKRFLIYLVLTCVAISCGSSQVDHSTRSAELVVHYEGKEVFRRNNAYTSEQELTNLLKTKQDFVIIFAADWCSACKQVKKALKQAKLPKRIYFLNVDELWVQKLAALMGVKNIPLMVHTNSTGNTIAAFVGPKDILLYLLLNFR